jgi:GR25 family glycosyltransferase involved in LPS biosynthesis
MPHPLLEYIFYINLDSRPDRNKQTIQELLQIGTTQNFERFPAITHSIGAVGCTLSHIRCIEMAKERSYPYVFICEDDIQFLQPLVLQENLQKFWDTPPPDDWDVLILGGNNFQPYEVFSDYAIHVHFCATTTGYIVAQHYYDTLLDNFKQSAQLLEKHSEKHYLYAIDVFWRKLQKPKESRWYMLIPPTVTQRPNYSDIEKKEVDYGHWMLVIDKQNSDTFEES